MSVVDDTGFVLYLAIGRQAVFLRCQVVAWTLRITTLIIRTALAARAERKGAR